MKRWMVIVLIVIAVIIIWRNKDKILDFLGLKAPSKEGADLDISSVNMNDYQSKIDGLMQTQADLIAAGDTDTGEMLTIQKKVAILKLAQKLGIQFTLSQTNQLLGMSLAELTSFLSMSQSELQNRAIAQGWTGVVPA